MFEHIIFTNEDGVLRVILNRTQVHHALNQEMIVEITEAIKVAAEDDKVRVVLLTGAGDKAFCSGADLKSTLASGKPTGDMLREFYNPMILALRNLPKPVVCRLNGLAAGAGASLALACDLIVASEDAYLTQIFVQIGLMPDAGATFFLPRLVGTAKAFELASSGRRVHAKEAVELGLIARAVPATELDQVVEAVVAGYKEGPTKAIGAMKLVMNQSLQSSLAEMLELEAENQNSLSNSSDAKVGINSFLHKKKPDYQGR